MSVVSDSRIKQVTTVHADFLEYVHDDLAAVETALNGAVASEVRHMCALGEHVLLAGGKRLRPAVVILATRALTDSPDMAHMIAVAASVELVHMATLVHDDVVDNTSVRRGKATANAVFGNDVAVIAGDFLLARSMQLLTDRIDVRIMRTVSDITVEMSEGEVLEILATGDASITRDRYLEVTRKKTAAFIEGCCRCGAILSGGTDVEEAALALFGKHLGIAFQIIDDVLDYAGDPAVTGKAVGSDLRTGRATLPFLIALEKATDGQRDRLLGAFGNQGLGDPGIAGIVKLIENLGGVSEARSAAREHHDAALRALETVPSGRARDCMVDLAAYVLERDR